MFSDILIRVPAVAVAFVLVSLAVFVGRERLETTRREWKPRLRTGAPVLVALLVTLGINRVMRQAGPELSEEIGIHMTDTFRRIEGDFILVFQAIESSAATTYFSVMYVYGYAFLLIFPVAAYFALSDTVPFRRLLTAYTLNYLLGLVLYVFIIVYGPRNLFVELVTDTMLYDTSPEYMELTTEVNVHTNVFPSLHTSLSATVATFAYATRSEYPYWFPVACVLAVSIIVSTMYLGIHWGIDVLAGLVLAAVCVAFSGRLVGRWSVPLPFADDETKRDAD